MYISGAMVTMDTSVAQAALANVEGQRSIEEQAIIAFLTAWEGRRGFTKRTAERMKAELEVMFRAIDKKVAESYGSVKKLSEHATKSTRYIMMHVYHFASQCWNIIETAFSLSKNTTSQMIGFAISAMTSIISAGYAAAAQYTAMGPWGIVLAMPSLIMAGINVATQSSMYAQKAGLESQPDVIGNMFWGYPN